MGKYVGNRTVVLSAAGRTVISGIHDGHVHPTAVVQYLIYPTLDDAQLTLAAMQSALNGFLASPDTVFRGDWLFVLGWNPVACPVDALPAVKQYLDDLDNPQDRPIILRGSDGHNSYVNSRALQVTGIDDNTPNPTGGVIVRDASGHATGVLVDNAQDLVTATIPSLTAEEQLPWFGAISGYMASMGITSFQDAWVTPESIELYALAGAQGLMRQRAQAMLLLPEEYFGNPAAGLAWAEGLAQAYGGTPWLSIRTIKIFLDGVIEFPAQTAALIDPYLDADGTPTGNRGNLYVDTATLSSIITVFDRAGWQVHMHAIGDRAVRTGLDAVAAARAANPGSAVRHTIAHLQLSRPGRLRPVRTPRCDPGFPSCSGRAATSGPTRPCTPTSATPGTRASTPPAACGAPAAHSPADLTGRSTRWPRGTRSPPPSTGSASADSPGVAPAAPACHSTPTRRSRATRHSPCTPGARPTRCTRRPAPARSPSARTPTCSPSTSTPPWSRPARWRWPTSCAPRAQRRGTETTGLPGDAGQAEARRDGCRRRRQGRQRLRVHAAPLTASGGRRR